MDKLKDADLVVFGKNVARIRERLGWSRTFAAMKGLVNNSQLKRIEEGGDFQYTTIIKISKGWGVPLVDFFEPFLTEDIPKSQKGGKGK
jgi:transcriptional regulator with XRE-family HTH domain